jgi:hypothetical protein
MSSTPDWMLHPHNYAPREFLAKFAEFHGDTPRYLASADLDLFVSRNSLYGQKSKTKREAEIDKGWAAALRKVRGELKAEKTIGHGWDEAIALAFGKS